jgi:hypothetical protein
MCQYPVQYSSVKIAQCSRLSCFGNKWKQFPVSASTHYCYTFSAVFWFAVSTAWHYKSYLITEKEEEHARKCRQLRIHHGFASQAVSPSMATTTLLQNHNETIRPYWDRTWSNK